MIASMNKILAAGCAALTLALTGCGGGGSKAVETTTVTASAAPSSPSSPPSGTPYGADPSFEINDTQYIAKLRAKLGEKGTDDQLRAIGIQACKDMRDVGTPVEDYIRALYGTDGYTDDQISFLVATSARRYCPTPHIEEQVRALSK